ncbi:MAG: hypothetical protein JXA21_27945 [Anaerolineae bacterium]|nr:hypothetical protein [Anaerolineae bacterium]
MSTIIPQEWLSEQRAYRYYRTPERRLHTVADARAFVDEVGFCHFWPIKDIELPNLLHAIAGRVRDVPDAHDDPDGSKCWGWKDESLDKKWWYYGKLLRRRATLVSLEMLPTLYACSESFGDLEDYLMEYRDGLLTLEAKDIYEALLRLGPLDTIRLRKEAHMSAESAKARFERALVELQVGLKVLPVGVAATGAWHYSFIYELVQRHFPTLAEQAHGISRSQAQQTLIQKYVDNIVCSDRDTIAKVFHVLKWTPAELEKTITTLLNNHTLEEAQLEGVKQPQLLSTRGAIGN